jgi:hypothetical protein
MAELKDEPDQISYISHKDIEILRERIPIEFRSRLREIFPQYETLGVRRLGWVSTNGRRDVNICVYLPYRVSLRRFLVKGQSAFEFGTSPRGQWTPWAVRRYLLYDVFLHEVGHLQIIHSRKSNNNRKYASETKAQEFADNLRRELWKTHFEHSDPIHNSPQEDELSVISLWQKLDKKQRFNLVGLAIRAPYETLPDLSEFGEIDENQMSFLSRALCFDS